MELPYNVSSRLLESEPMQRCTLGECHAACCLYGVWLDRNEAAAIIEHKELIKPHLSPGFQDSRLWFDDQEDDDPHAHSGKVSHSKVVRSDTHYGGTACVFLRSDYKCALQVAADQNELHPWRFKPFYCILHPLDVAEDGKITLDHMQQLLDEPGSCLRPAEKPIPLIKTFEPELRYLLGDRAYQDLLNLADLYDTTKDR